MTSLMRRRELITTGAVASTATLLPSPLHSYGDYWLSRRMRAPALGDGESVWQWLVLLIDASSSMRRVFERMSFYDLQIEATAHALTEPCVVDRLIGTPRARTAIGAILWSANMQQEIAVDWGVIRSADDIAAIATRLRRTANYLDSDTGVAAAVRFAITQLTAPHISKTSRKVIDISSNGRDNLGGDPAAAASEAEQLGITINAVVMKGYDGTVEEMQHYYLDQVATVDGHVFKVVDETNALNALAIAKSTKLCAEIASAPASLGGPA